MKIGLHAYSLQLAAGLRQEQPPEKSLLTLPKMLAWARSLKLTAVQLANSQLPHIENSSDRMVELLKIREHAGDLTLHLSTNLLKGSHLEEMIRTAHTLGAKQVTVPLSRLSGNVQQRKTRLEALLKDLDTAIRRAERYGVMLAIENGRHTSTADLAALIEAANSEWVGACFDIGNALTVPESPVEAAGIILKRCKSVHIKDLKGFRTKEGVILKNCPPGKGMAKCDEVLKILTEKPEIVFFIQSVAERIKVPLLQDEFLAEYPRITARALAGLLYGSADNYTPEDLRFPHESKIDWGKTIFWEKQQVKLSHDYLLKKPQKEEQPKSGVLDFNEAL